MSIERALRVCREGSAHARDVPYLKTRWAKHDNDFLAWWERSPVGNSDTDLAQWYEMTRMTSNVALEMFETTTVMPLSAGRLQMPSGNADAAFAASMNADLGRGVAYFDLDNPHAIGSGDMPGCEMFGALCWRLENAGLNVIPFARQNGNDAAFGHMTFDPAGAWAENQSNIAIHPGLTVVSRDQSVITPVEIDSQSLCGSTLRAGVRMAHLVVGALWSLEASG